MILSIRFRTFVGFFILSLILVLGAISTIYYLNKLDTSSARETDRFYNLIKACDLLRKNVRDEIQTFSWINTGELVSAQPLLRVDSIFQRNYSILKSNVKDESQKVKLDSLYSFFQSFVKEREKLLFKQNSEENFQPELQKIRLYLNVTLNLIDEIQCFYEESLYNGIMKIQDTLSRAVIPGLVTIITALVFVLIFAYLNDLLINKPIVRLSKALRGYVTKEEPFKLTVLTRDEIYDLVMDVENLCTLRERGKD